MTARVEDTTSSLDNCQSINITLQNASGSTVYSTQLNDNAATMPTVSTPGTYSLKLTAANGCTPSSPLMARVILTSGSGLIGPALKVVNPALTKGAVNQVYNATININGGTSPYTFTANTALPAGLTLNARTGVISGTPTKAGTYTFMVKIADSATPVPHWIRWKFWITIS